jgi:hypothetical protein
MEIMINFEKIDIKHRIKYEEFLRESGIVSSKYSFLGLWAWKEPENTEIFFGENLCWLKNRRGILSPICNPEQDWVKIIQRYFPEGIELYDVPEVLTYKLSSLTDAQINEMRSEWEYVYATKDLIELKGRAYSQKRAHVKIFEKKYENVYFPLLAEDFDELKKFQSEWLKRQKGGIEELSILSEENKAIMSVLENWADFPLFGACIKIEGRIAAYTIAEELSNDTVDIRFEKAFPEYEGIYQFLNKTFLSRQAKDYVWVNREEDMGDEGLHKAKSSYHPIRYEKKYLVNIPPR